MLCLFRDVPKKKKRGLVVAFFWRDFFTIYSFKIGFEMSLGINRLFGLIDNDTFYSEFFFRKSFFFLLCELLLRQHNDFDRRKKVVERNELFFWSNLSSFFTFRQLENNYLQCWIDVLESQCCQLCLFCNLTEKVTILLPQCV